MLKKVNHFKKLVKKVTSLKKLLRKELKTGDLFILQYEIFITVGPWLMKLYTTTPSILTLVAWVPQSRLAIGIL